jgi:hypothetical protein
MRIDAFADSVFPSRSLDLFDKILTLGWYDGITSDLACITAASEAFRFDLLAWGPRQDRRVFAISAISASQFDQAVRLLSEFGPPVWPSWHARWPSNEDEGALLGLELDRVLANADRPEFVIEAGSMFETVFAAKNLSGLSLKLLPDHFDGQPYLDNFDYWHQYLGLTA